MNQNKRKELEKIILRDYENIAGMTILKDGKTLYDGCFNGCAANSRFHIYSVTKSIISILIGIALDNGYLENVNQKVLDFFPDYTVKRGEKTIQNITLFHLLTMTAPYKYRFAPYIRYFTSEDSVKFTLDLLGGRGRDGGNAIYVNAKNNIVISIASLFKRNARDRIKLIQNYIEPMLEN